VAAPASPAAQAAAPVVASHSYKVGITSFTAPPTILPLLAQNRSIARAHGLELQFVSLSPDVAAQALATGSIDILAAPSIETAILQGLEARVIAGAAKPYFSLWGRNGAVTTWTDLKGKRLGVPAGKGSAADVLFQNLLQAQGLSLTDVTFSYNSAATNYQALTAGSVDAALTTPPYAFQLQTAGGFTLVDDLASKQGESLSTQYTMSMAQIKADPSSVQRFVEMLLEVQQHLYQSPIDPQVVSTYETYLSQNGTNSQDVQASKFFAELARRKAWQVIPTRALIAGDLKLLGQLAQFQAAATKAQFEDIVYIIPSLANLYDQ
jgi:ABC-type nitrate/sulfonate/bicarbonate transport system substrate-binding protein